MAERLPFAPGPADTSGSSSPMISPRGCGSSSFCKSCDKAHVRMREIQPEQAQARAAMIASGAEFGRKLLRLQTESKHMKDATAANHQRATQARTIFGDIKNHSEIPKAKKQKVHVLKQLGEIKARLTAIEKETEEKLLQHVCNAQEVCQDAIETIVSALVKDAIEDQEEL